MADLARTKKLIKALENDDLEAVETLLAGDLDVDAFDDQGASYLERLP